MIGKYIFVSQPSQEVSPLESDCLRDTYSEYKLVQPLLICGVNSPKEIIEFRPLEDKINKIILSQSGKITVNSTSVYFRDLTNGHWMGINENISYEPGSLLKVPIMIAYFKEAESDPRILSEKLLYEPLSEETSTEGFVTLIPNKYYSTNQLIQTMIIDSDNGAKDTLLKHIDFKYLKEIYSDLGIKMPINPNADYQIDAKTYALFFRILRNGTYLSRVDSEKALELLGRTTFNDGLVLGVPNGMVVAHKYGTYFDANNFVGYGELHDCGIVYDPEHPYLLCVMTRGSKLSAMESIIQKISRTVFEEVNNNYQ